MKRLLALLLFILLPCGELAAQGIIGMNAQSVPITSISVPAKNSNAPRVIVLGGLSGDKAGTQLVRNATEDYANTADNQLDVVFVAAANPDGAPLLFPPNAPAYATNWTAWSLWRWLQSEAPDVIVIAGNDDYELGAALARDTAGPGAIPLINVHNAAEMSAVLHPRQRYQSSAAHLALDQRRARSARTVAEGLARVYGQQLTTLTYIPAMALIGKLRLGQLDEVERIVAPSLANADKVAITSSLQIAGHLLYAELAERTGKPQYLALAKRVADLGFDKDGKPLDVMPFNGDYSDAFFMETPILAKVGKLTGDTRYFDMALRHVNYMHAELLRSDGLYNHWPKAEAAWGRGNAFAAMGLALALSDLPVNHPAHARVLELYRALASNLLAHVDSEGMWHNVINVPGSWPEFTGTAMIALALQRGIHQGWIDKALYQNVVDRAWEGVNARTDDSFGFANVCESTVGQNSLEAYLNRKALNGRDDRAGGMMLMLATERLSP